MLSQQVWEMLSQAPMALFEQDHSAVAAYVERYDVATLEDLRGLLAEQPDVAETCLACVRLVRANRRALDLIEAGSLAELQRATRDVLGLAPPDQVLALAFGVPSVPVDLQLQTLGGELRDVRGAWMPVGTQVGRALFAAVDVTDRKEAERALRDSEANYRAVVDDQSEFIVRHLPDGTRTFVNKAYADYFGKPAHELVGTSFYPEIVEEERRAVRAELDELTPERPTRSGEHRVISADGTVRWNEWRDRAFFDDDGKIVELQSVGRDVTERKEAESALRAALDEVERLRDQLDAENRYLREELRRRHNFGHIIGDSEPMLRVVSEIELVAPTQSTVLICGETGTGKELIAHAVHELSGRRDRVLVKVNCSAVAAGLVESELFGHEQGAFTGAHKRRRGRFELAHGGTLFLDEVGELALEVQAKLLRVLQEQEFERVGSSAPIRVNVRILAATNRDLEEAVEAGTFRADLYYRLNVFPVQVPTLRARREDIPLLAESFLQTMSARLAKRLTGFAPETLDWMLSYDWPGNVRELQNFVERAAILATGPIVQRPRVTGIRRTPPGPGAVVPDLASAERAHIELVLRRTGGVISGDGGAARVLGLPPSTLRSKMKKLGITKRR